MDQIIGNLSRTIKTESTSSMRKAIDATGGVPVYQDMGGILLIVPLSKVVRYDCERDCIAEVTDAPWRLFAFVCAARKYPELVPLAPMRPPNANACPVCIGTGFILDNITCATCMGLGWAENNISNETPIIMQPFKYGGRFQMWSYTVGHGQLLLRRTPSATNKKLVDILFVDVKSISLPASIDELEVMVAEHAPPSTIIGSVGSRKVFIVRGTEVDGYVVAGAVFHREWQGTHSDPSPLNPPFPPIAKLA
jgi:hypothetical protein